MKKVYCKNCVFEKKKESGYGQTIESKYFGRVSHYIKGCGREQIDFKENENGYSFIPYRNRNNDCSSYKREWYKFWV